MMMKKCPMILKMSLVTKVNQKKMKAHELLSDLFDKVQEEGNCTDYVTEMCNQLELYGTETNTLTKIMVHDKLEKVLDKIKANLSIKD